MRSTAALVDSPYIAGYQLVGFAAATYDSLPSRRPLGAPRENLVWLATADRPTAPSNSARRTLKGELQFVLGGAPEPVWDALLPLVPPLSAVDSLFLAGTKGVLATEERQPRIALTIRIDDDGKVNADTTFVTGNRLLRVRLERIDTIALPPMYR
jgi:hypothetical protein